MKLTGQSASYDHGSDVIGFLSFKTDLFHKQGLELLGDQKLPKQMLGQVLVDLSFGQMKDGVSVVYSNPCAQFVLKQLKKAFGTKASQVEEQLRTLKQHYNTMLHESKSLLEQKYRVLERCVKQQQALLKLVCPDRARDVVEISEQNYAQHLDDAIRDSLILLTLFSTQGQVDPAVLKQNQSIVLEELLGLADEELAIIN